MKSKVLLILFFCGFLSAHAADNGELKGRFVIGVDGEGNERRICFSQGNLVHSTSANAWSFADNQYEVLGADNYDNGELADKIDLFGWSGNASSASNYGISNETGSMYYSGDFKDWGANRITNGGNEPGIWRTLTADEWTYLLEHHQQGHAVVEGVTGVILVPINTTVTLADSYSADEWAAAEAQGLVFLPYTGYRAPSSSEVIDLTNNGKYWTATTPSGNRYADAIICTSHAEMLSVAPNRYFGHAVRLVKDKSSCEVTFTITADPEQGSCIITVSKTDN